MQTSWRRNLTMFIGVLTTVLVAVNCSVIKTQAVSTFTEAEIESMAKRATPAYAAAGAEPQLPTVYLNTTYVAPTGKTIAVAAGGDFQAAIDQALPGDVITLQAGASFTGNFKLPAKSGNSWIIIRSSAPDSSLPPAGTRITPAYASVLPKILTPNNTAAIEALDGAHHFRFIGVEVAQAAGVQQSFSLIELGSNQTSLAQLPHDLIFDRVYLHGSPTVTLRRAIALNSASTAIIDSYISDCHEVGADSQAIGGWNGAGPFKIVNNYLEGAGENFILGGADPSIPNLVPSDIEFRRNHCFKPLTWRIGDPTYAGTPWGVKNLFELKNAQRVLVDGNLFEHNWTMAQNGFAILLTVRNQDGNSPWSVVQDVTFTNNIIRDVASGFNMHGKDDNFTSMLSQRVRISNNLLIGVNGQIWDGAGIAFQLNGGPNDVTIEHNTVFHSGTIMTTGAASERLVFNNNLLSHNEYGIKGDGRGTGNDTIVTYFPDSVFKKNVMVGGQSDLYPADNFFPASFDAVGFVGFATGLFRLTAASPYKNGGTDGKDIGVDFDLLDAAFIGVTLANVSAASYNPAALAPESIAACFGTGFSATTLPATTVPLPTSLGGTSVKVRDSAGVERLSPLFVVNPTQINYQVPAETATGLATVSVVNGNSLIAIGTVPIAPTAPGLFSADSLGRGLPAGVVLRVKADQTQVYESMAVFDTTQNKFVATPINVSSPSELVYLVLYGTGIRRHGSLSGVTATVGGVNAPIAYAGAQNFLQGVDQVNILVPSSLAGRREVDVILTVNGVAANTVQVTIQ